MKQELLDLLEKNGYNKYFDELYANNVTVEDFVKAHPDIIKIPGAVDVLQSKASSAPHNLTEAEKDAYFFEDPESRKRYEAEESKLAKDLSEKKRLVDEYKRSKDDSYFNTEFGPFQLANEYARKQHIKGNEGKAWANEAAAKLAFATDFTPFPFSMIGPVIRLNQTTWNEPDKVTDPNTWRDFGVDLGTSVMGQAKGAAKAGYEGVKQAVGPVLGKLFNTKRAKSLEKSLEAIDARELAKEAAARRKQVYETVTDFKSQFDKGLVNDTEVLDFAKEIENEYPELAKSMREHVRALAANRKAATEAKLAKDVNAKNAPNKEAERVITEKALPAAKEKASIELFESADDAKKAFYNGEVLVDANGNLIQDVKDIDKAWDVFRTAEASKVPGVIAQSVSKPAVKAGMLNTYTDDTDYSKYEKDNKSAIDWTIDKYKRQWDAGFTPRGNEGELVMKAYTQYLRDREGK